MSFKKHGMKSKTNAISKCNARIKQMFLFYKIKLFIHEQASYDFLFFFRAIILHSFDYNIPLLLERLLAQMSSEKRNISKWRVHC